MRLVRLTSVIFIAFVAAIAFGGVNVWTTGGPEGAYVAKLLVDPADANTLFAVTAAGIYKTSDGGGNWTSQVLPDGTVTSFVVVPGNPETLYATLSNGELWASVDRGQHWSVRGHRTAAPQPYQSRLRRAPDL